MFTPQEIQERSVNLEKAVFGGYSMSSVEELLTPLAKDYATLYKENSVLKSKLKVLVERVEGYRTSEDSLNRVLVSAQKTADELVADAQRKSSKMIADAEQSLRQRSQELKAEVAAEEERVVMAKRAALEFIADIEDRVQAQLEQLEQLKKMDLTLPEPKAERIPEMKPAEPAAKPEESEDTEDSGDSVERQLVENINRIFEEAAKGMEKDTPAESEADPVK